MRSSSVFNISTSAGESGYASSRNKSRANEDGDQYIHHKNELNVKIVQKDSNFINNKQKDDLLINHLSSSTHNSLIASIKSLSDTNNKSLFVNPAFNRFFNPPLPPTTVTVTLPLPLLVTVAPLNLISSTPFTVVVPSVTLSVDELPLPHLFQY